MEAGPQLSGLHLATPLQLQGSSCARSIALRARALPDGRLRSTDWLALGARARVRGVMTHRR